MRSALSRTLSRALNITVATVIAGQVKPMRTTVEQPAEYPVPTGARSSEGGEIGRPGARGRVHTSVYRFIGVWQQESGTYVNSSFIAEGLFFPTVVLRLFL